MKIRVLRLLVVGSFVAGLLIGPAAPAPAVQVCGHVTVWVGTDAHPVPLVTYCDQTCQGGIWQGPNQVPLGPVMVRSWECVREL
ncbi:MAG: hypothetical protein ABR507_11170 [Actinomycetota bacterium]